MKNTLKNTYTVTYLKNMKHLKLILLFLIIFTFSCTVYKPQSTVNKEDLTFSIIGKDPETEEDFQKLDEYIKNNPDTDDAFIALQRYLKPSIDHHKWSEALNIIRKFEPYLTQQQSKVDNLKSLISEPEENKVNVTKLPSTVNTKADEYSPVISSDGKTLYFVSYGRQGSYGGEDIYSSNINGKEYSQAVNLGPPINTNSHEALTSISTDGTELCIFGNYPCQWQRGNLYTSKLTNNGWSTPVPFPEPINTNDWDGDGFFTSDGMAFIFTSDRIGGTAPYVPKDTKYHGSTWGNTDIYVCQKTKYGWSKPVNLGTTINTPYAERKPFLHPDGKTLYFSSEGHGGLGRLDVFKSTRLSETDWTQWSEPQNLGKQINTTSDDWGYKVTTDGSKVFFSALNEEDSIPNLDIYEVTLPEKARPEEVFVITGTVTDENGKPLEADLVWEDVATGKEIGRLKSNPQNGSYFIAVPFGKKLGYYASKEGYYETSSYVDLTARSKTDKVVQDIVLVSIKKMIEEGQTVRLNNIFFDYDKYDLKSESFPELDRLLKFLNENQDLKVQISAHTDNQGSDTYNQKLSENRAKSVVDYLITKGIAQNRLKSVGYGKKQPITTNETEEGRAQNRRVEFKFIK